MGAYDSVQITDLSIYILDTRGRVIDPKQAGLNWGDGFIFIPDSNDPNTSKIHKKIMRAFNLIGFKIEKSSNLKIVNFLDITFNLSNNTFKPFNKDNQNTDVHYCQL